MSLDEDLRPNGIFRVDPHDRHAAGFQGSMLDAAITYRIQLDGPAMHS